MDTKEDHAMLVYCSKENDSCFKGGVKGPYYLDISNLENTPLIN